jgi:hypothetical protein
MDVSLTGMRWLALAPVLGVLACGPDPSLSVEVDQPNENRIGDALRETTVSIYESDGLTCDQIEFGDLTTEQLEALLKTRVSIVKGTGTSDTFSGVSRLGHKVIVARGLGEKGGLLTAACAELDEIHEGETLKLKAVVAAKVSIATAEQGDGILITTTEPLAGSKSLNDRKVWWRLYAASGAMADTTRVDEVATDVWEPKAPTCTSGGEVTVHPVPPRVPGGYALRLRVSWATEPLPLITRFTELPHVVRDLGTPPAVIRPCAVRRSGATASVVCITAPQVATELRLQGGALVPVATAPLTVHSDAAIGIVAVDRDVYAITEHGNWQALFGAPAPPGPVNRNWWCDRVACGTQATFDLQIVPACGSKGSYLLAKVGATAAGADLLTMPLLGGVPAELDQGPGQKLAFDTIANAGCLNERQRDGSQVQRQAIAVGLPVSVGAATGLTAALLFDCAAKTVCRLQQGNDGIGFVPETPPRMVISTFDATGAMLTSVDAQPNEGLNANDARDRLIEVARQPSAAPPDQLIAGHFDTDTTLDLLWHFSTRATGATIQIAYAREIAGTPLTGIASYGRQPIEELLVGDLDGNRIDEVIAVLGPGGRRLDVIPMGIPYPPSAPHDDPPCP